MLYLVDVALIYTRVSSHSPLVYPICGCFRIVRGGYNDCMNFLDRSVSKSVDKDWCDIGSQEGSICFMLMRRIGWNERLGVLQRCR